MRIVSLLPAATEIVYLLGLEKYLVGVSGDCDWPEQVKKIPVLTSSEISNAMSSLEIDMTVRKKGHKGNGVFHIDQNKLKELKPDLILTQELCDVCAVGFNQVKKAARILDSEVKIISLEPESVEDIMENILLVGEATGRRQQARKVVTDLKKRIVNCKSHAGHSGLKIVNSKTRPRVLVIEWLDPLMVAGHWVPEMIEMVGGEMLITKLGEKSRKIKRAQFNLNPDIVIIAPCGFDTQRTIQEKHLLLNVKSKMPNTKFFLMDGNSYMTRPGPRVVDGIEILAEIFYPEIFSRKHSRKDWISVKI